MGTRRVALLFVAAMVVASGCAGSDIPSPADPGTATATGTTPTASEGTTTAARGATAETTTTGAANLTLPPGLNRTGVEDPAALAAAHRSALNNTSYGFRFGANVSVGPAVQWTVQRGTVARGSSPLVVHSRSIRHVDGDTMEVATDLWANESAVVVRYHRNNRTELRRYNRTTGNAGVYDETWAHLPRADLRSQVTQTWLVELALTVGKYDVARTERRGGRRVWVLRATEPVAATNYTDLNSTLVVDRTGRVRSLSLTAAYAGDNATRIHYAFELTDVGTASVSRPSWVGAAIPPNATTTAATTTVSTTVTTTASAPNATTTTAK